MTNSTKSMNLRFLFLQEAMSNLPNAIRDLPAFMERLMGNHAGINGEDDKVVAMFMMMSMMLTSRLGSTCLAG